jgi:hypothetical protein
MPNGKIQVEYLRQLTRAERQHYLGLGLVELPPGREVEFVVDARTPFHDCRNRQLELEVPRGHENPQA